MKKIAKIMLIFIILFGYTQKAFASTVTWKQITDKWKELAEEGEIIATITSDDTSLRIETTENNYVTGFNYDNGLITWVRPDMSSLSTEEQMMAEFSNYAMIIFMVNVISQLYDVDLNKLDENNFENYGITITAEEVEYSEESGSSEISYGGDSIQTFSINLDTFESSTKSLQGTYNAQEEPQKSFDITEPTVSLTLGKAYSDSLELIVNVKDLSENSTAKCEIYLMPEEGTAYATGESYIIGTINDCKNGNNISKISNLKENSKYTFQVVMTEELSFGMTNQILGEKYVTLSTVTKAIEQKDQSASVDSKGNILTNPQTSTIAFFVTIISAIISATSFILLYLKNRRERLEV